MKRRNILKRLVSVLLVFVMVFGGNSYAFAKQQDNKDEVDKQKKSVEVIITNVPENHTTTVGTTLDFDTEIRESDSGKGKMNKGVIRFELAQDTAGVGTISEDGVVIPTQVGSFKVRALYFQNEKSYNAWTDNKKKCEKYLLGSSEWCSINVEDTYQSAPVMTLKGDPVIFIQVGDTYADPGVTVYDMQDGDISAKVETYGLEGLDTNIPGEYNIFYIGFNSAGYAAYQYRKLVVADLATAEAPVISLGWLVNELPVGSQTSDYDYVAWDYQDGDITDKVVIGGDTIDTNKIGIYTVTFDVSDSEGNAAEQKSVKVVVQDPENPLDYTAPSITLNGPYYYYINVGEPYIEYGATAWDDIDQDINSKIIINSNVNEKVPGTYQVTYEVTDAAGNYSDQVVRTVVVVDWSGPVITLNGDPVIYLTTGQTYQELGATAIDNMDGDVTANIKVEQYVDTSNPGTYWVGYYVSDSLGNSSYKARTVVVSEANTNAAPVILLNGFEVVLQLGSEYVEPGAVAYDDKDGNISDKIIINGVLNPNVEGIYYLTYDVQDSDGLSAAQVTRKVVFTDMDNPIDYTPPYLTLDGALYSNMNIGDTYVEAGFNAWDDRDGDISDKVVVSSNLNTALPGTYTITYDVTDSSGNASHAERIIYISDWTPPVITLNGEPIVFLTVGDTYQELGATAIDNVDGDITANMEINPDVNTYYPGRFNVNYSVSDSSGNISYAARTIIVSPANSSVAPVITLNGFYTQLVQLGAPYVEAGAIAYDEKDGNISGSITIDGSVDTNTEGIYYITYDVTDSDGLSAEQVIRKVVVTDLSNPIDYSAPYLQLLGDYYMTVNLGDAYVEPGYTATDDTDGDLTGSVTVEGNVETNTVGEYVLTYRCKDSAGNETIQTRHITVYSVNYENVHLNGDRVMFLNVGEEFVDPGVTIIKSTGEDVSSQVIVDGTVDINTPGTYQIYYDNNHLFEGYSYYLCRTVIIHEKDVAVAPVITSDFSVLTVLLGSEPWFPSYFAFDDVEGNITSRVVVGGDIPDFNTVGTYVLTYNVSDLDGNAAQQLTITINVVEQY